MREHYRLVRRIAQQATSLAPYQHAKRAVMLYSRDVDIFQKVSPLSVLEVAMVLYYSAILLGVL